MSKNGVLLKKEILEVLNKYKDTGIIIVEEDGRISIDTESAGLNFSGRAELKSDYVAFYKLEDKLYIQLYEEDDEIWTLVELNAKAFTLSLLGFAEEHLELEKKDIDVLALSDVCRLKEHYKMGSKDYFDMLTYRDVGSIIIGGFRITKGALKDYALYLRDDTYYFYSGDPKSVEYTRVPSSKEDSKKAIVDSTTKALVFERTMDIDTYGYTVAIKATMEIRKGSSEYNIVEYIVK